VDGVDEAAQLEPYSVADRHHFQVIVLVLVLGSEVLVLVLVFQTWVAPGSTMLNASASGRDADLPGSRGSVGH